jgi:PIN domain nuclease of toxin-antitoxin system
VCEVVVAGEIGAHLQRLRSLGDLRETPQALPETLLASSFFPDDPAEDPADRLIYATAIEHGVRLVTKDRRLRAHRHPQPLALW